jgi:CBS domain-containing protein
MQVFPGSRHRHAERNMTVESILLQKGREVTTISPADTVKSAADRMRERNIAALPVVTCDTIVGVISERDIARAFSRHGSDLASMKVSEILGRGVVTAVRDDDIKRVVTLMTHKKTRYVLVIEDKLAGIVSMGDVVRHRLDDLELKRNVPRDVYLAAH